MVRNEFYQLFIRELRDLYSSENQLLLALPKMVAAASHKDLKEAFNLHLKESQNQIHRLDKIFSALNETPSGEQFEAMEGLIREATDIQNQNYPDLVRDAALISIAQKIEHYKIAGYGTAKTFAKHLDNKEAAMLLKETLEEGHADKALTAIAEGGFFTSGINAMAASAK